MALDQKKILCVIPARGGSKRLPGKNIMPICGKPMVQWVYEAAKSAPSLDRIILSTEDKGIAATCAQFGFVDWIKRPQHLAADDTTTADAVIDLIINNNEIDGKPLVEIYDYIALMQVTSPLVQSIDVEQTVARAMRNKVRNCISAAEQNPTAPNGAVYVLRIEDLISQKKFALEGGDFYVMPQERSVDIDTIEDFEKAEAIMRILTV